MRLKIASWNVNSIRARLDAMEQFVATQKPDIMCLQETKVVDQQFPTNALEKLGYPNYELFGQKAYHGVAIFARDGIDLSEATRKQWCGIDDTRHLYCTIPGGIELHNFYIPAGGDEPDPDVNDKFAHKLSFMTEVSKWFRKRKKAGNKFILVGDLNVAPEENDVWSHKQLLKVVSHTPVEVEHMAKMYKSHDWIDAIRHFTPAEERLYSWWSYRSKNWELADKGRRLDHVWVTPALQAQLHNSFIFKDARGFKPPTDHAPAIVEIDV